MCSSRRYSHPTPIHGQSSEILKNQEEKALKEKSSMWGMNLFLKKTMSERSLITKYCLRNIYNYLILGDPGAFSRGE